MAAEEGLRQVTIPTTAGLFPTVACTVACTVAAE